MEGQRLEGLPEPVKELKETAMSTLDRRQFLMGAGVAGRCSLGGFERLLRGSKRSRSAT